jgi:hypothetical protein
MKTKINFLLAALTNVILLQSCLKDHGPVIRPSDDRLLLSKVTGTNKFVKWNSFEFGPFNGDTAHYAASYSYGNEHFGFEDLRPIQEISFPNNGGNWTFTYSNHLPDKVIDNSAPGKDQGYWKFYFNTKGQIIKTGLAFKNAAEPTQFEFYEYDEHNNLAAYVYGANVDTPYYKVVYKYDAAGNLTQWQYLFSNGYKDADAQTNQRIFSSLANSPATEKAVGKPMAVIMKKAATLSRERNASAKNAFFKTPPTTLGDSNVIYLTYITVAITNDGKINPYHQQDRILFFITNRYYSSELNAQYRELQKSNPVTVTYTVNPDLVTSAPIVSNYTYTYNTRGYPVTSHEATSGDDITPFWSALPAYTQDRQYEYINNH